MSQQIQITGGAKVRALEGVITGTSGVLDALPINGSLGIPQLDVNGKILVSQLPNSVMEYQGTWNVTTNTPYLVDGVGNQGDVYIVTNAASTGTAHDFGSGSITFFNGDQAIYSGTIWQRASGATGTVTSVGLSTDGNAITIGSSPITTSGTITANFAGTSGQYINGAGNLTTFPTLLSSVGLSMPSAFSVANSPLTANGTIAVTGAGYPSQYIRGDGTLADFPTSGGGGSSVSYYLNGGTSQGTIGGVTYYEMSKTADTGTGVDFPLVGDGLIVSFLTDAGDPAQLNIPAGNWNYEIYASMSSNGGTPQMYAELYVYNGTTFTLISTSSNEILYDGVNLNLYTFAMTVPATTLALTDRLAIKLYSTNSGGKTTTVHTQDSHLCQVITTFSTGITALNGLTAQVQYFATGTSGTDFAISSSTATHTFNLPTASATNRGALSSANWSTFNSKQDAISLTTTGTTGAATFISNTLNIPDYTYTLPTATSSILGGVKIGSGVTITSGVISVSTNYQAPITLTTTGSSGSATFVTNTLNVPAYTLSGLGGQPLATNLTSLSGLTYASTSFVKMTASGTFALDTTAYGTGSVTSVAALTLGTSGTDLSSTVATGTTTPVITLNVPTASATNRGALSSTDWSTFNSKESALTFSSPLVRTTNTISIPAATTSVNGYLTSTDWTTFNSKANALSGTINTIAYWNSSTTISSLALATYPSLTELSYVKGVTSAIQTQLGTKIPYTGTGISVYGLSAIGEYDGGSQIPAGYGGNYALTLGNGAIGNGLSLYTTGYIDAGAIRTAGYSRVTNATASTSTTTGAFVVTGGVGIGGALYGTTINLSSSITSTSFIKSGATSSDFLKGDGSIDSNTYVSSSALAGYLPLTGGTLSGSLQVGSPSATATANLAVTKTITGGTAARGILSDGQIQSDVTGSAYYYQSKAYTAAGSYTIALLSHYRAEKSSIGSSSVVTTQIGFNADNSLGTTTGGYANTNYGFYGNLSTSGFSTNYNVYMAGTAYNYFQGITGIGATPSGSYTLDVTGTGRFTGALTVSGKGVIGGTQLGVFTAYSHLTVGSTATTNVSLTIASTNASSGLLEFADGTTGNEAYRGYIQYSHQDDSMVFGTASSNRLTIASTGAATFSSSIAATSATFSGNVIIGGSSPVYLKFNVQETSANRVAILYRGLQGYDASMVTTFGTPYLSIGGQENLVNSIQTIGFGFTNGTSYIQPAEIGFQTTSLSAYTKGDLVFATREVTTNTAPTERMRITSAGNVGIGTSSPNYAGYVSGISVLTIAPTASERWGALELAGNRTAGGNQVGSISFTNINTSNTEVARIQVENGASSVSQGNIVFYTNGGTITERMRLTAAGNLGLTRVPTTNTLEVNGDASKSTAGLWAANSDINIKTDINTIEGALDRINKVRLVKFKYKDAYKENNQGIKDIYYHNVIAQEFKEVYADYVYNSGDLFEEKEVLQVDTTPMYIDSVSAIQELSKMVIELQERIKQLENK